MGVGLLLPLTGQNQEIGKSVLRSVNLAINKINDPILEIYPKNNFDNPDDNIKAAQELYNQGVRIFIGPIFDKNIKNLKKFLDDNDIKETICLIPEAEFKEEI